MCWLIITIMDNEKYPMNWNVYVCFWVMFLLQTQKSHLKPSMLWRRINTLYVKVKIFCYSSVTKHEECMIPPVAIDSIQDCDSASSSSFLSKASWVSLPLALGLQEIARSLSSCTFEYTWIIKACASLSVSKSNWNFKLSLTWLVGKFWHYLATEKLGQW